MNVDVVEAWLTALAYAWAGSSLLVWATALTSRGADQREDRRWFRDYLEAETERLTLERGARLRARLSEELAAWVASGGSIWAPESARSR
jgi:Uri superfamily endonuclease